MKVAIHVGQLLQPTPGGIGRYVEELVVALRDQPVSLLPFAAGPLPPAVRARLGSSHTELGYRDLGRPHGSPRYLLWHYLRGPGLRLGDVDVVHAPSVAVPPPGRAPLVVTIHDVAFLRYPEHFTRWGVRFHARGLALSRRHAAAIVVASEFTRDELVREGFEPGRIHVVPHGVRVEEPMPPDQNASRLRALGLERPFVLFVGTIEPRKGITLLIDVMREVRATHPTLELAVAGPRGWGAVAGLDPPWVRELGAVEDRDLDALYRAALLCAVPSRYEGFGFPVLEAMARSCPVLASDATSLPEVAGDDGLLLPVDDRKAWHDAIVALADDAGRRVALGERGRARARRYPWERSAAGHLAAYRAAADRAAADHVATRRGATRR